MKIYKFREIIFFLDKMKTTIIFILFLFFLSSALKLKKDKKDSEKNEVKVTQRMEKIVNSLEATNDAVKKRIQQVNKGLNEIINSVEEEEEVIDNIE